MIISEKEKKGSKKEKRCQYTDPAKLVNGKILMIEITRYFDDNKTWILWGYWGLGARLYTTKTVRKSSARGAEAGKK